METGIRVEPIVKTTSLSGILNSSAIIFKDGCLPFSEENFSMKRFICLAQLLIWRETLMLPSSRINRFISPAIIGTAYVENLTLKFSSKPLIAFKSPILASWYKSSYSTPLLRYRRTILFIKLLFSTIRVSFAHESPCFALRIRSFVFSTSSILHFRFKTF